MGKRIRILQTLIILSIITTTATSFTFLSNRETREEREREREREKERERKKEEGELEERYFVLIRNGDVYTPQSIGRCDVLLSGSIILAIYPSNETRSEQYLSVLGDDIMEIDAAGYIVTPGIIDPHVHLQGAGGEKGPGSRTPWGQIEQLANAGTTTIFGLTGTDSVSRSIEGLIQKLNGVRSSGITPYFWTGGYRVPTPTLLGNVERDVTLLDMCMGVGEVAISDHRSSWPSFNELTSLVSDARVGGLLGGKSGVSLFHVGSAPNALDPLWQIVNETTIPIGSIYPTHISSRGVQILEEGKRWISSGGVLDFTADAPQEEETELALLDYHRSGVDMSKVTLSSDAYGSLPQFDENGRLVGYEMGLPIALLDQIRTMIVKHKWTIEESFSLGTRNTATFLQLEQKGELQKGRDADLLLLSSSSLDLEYVFASGKMILSPDATAQGMFPCT